jgi:hemerythrin superfamily protein
MAGREKTSGPVKWALLAGGIAAGAALIPLIPVIKKRSMRVTTILKKDHRVVSGLILTLQMTPGMNTSFRKTLLEQIRSSVMRHTQAEEEILYPAIRNIIFLGGQPNVDQAYREHQQVKDLLNDLRTMDPNSDAFDAKFAEFKAKIEDHVDEEENQMFPMLMKRMSAEHQEELGEEIHHWKSRFKARMAA